MVSLCARPERRNFLFIDANYRISFARIRVGEITATQLERLEKSRGKRQAAMAAAALE
jgi:hypothetical protein